MNRTMRVALGLTLFGLTAGSTVAQPSLEPAEPQEGCTYYEETGHNLCGVFEEYWNANGGLPVFGYPITEAAPEENRDTGETYATQYFERARLEHHPANAGTPYEVLLGRLGNDVLLAQGRNWFEFTTAAPNAEHYVAETGHAIAPEFWDYWASHGSDFGDEGVSYRESLALFGYPISPAQMETNPDGDTVLTQWFERARFEHHPDNTAGQQVLLGRLGAEMLTPAEEPSPAELEVIAEGLNSPRGMVMDGGTLLVAEAGTGGDACFEVDSPEGPVELCYGESGSVTSVVDGTQAHDVTGLQSAAFGAEVVGPQDVIAGPDGLYVVMGLGGNPANREDLGDLADDLGWLLHVAPDGTVTKMVDVAAWEAADNPNGAEIDSNPYSLVRTDGGGFVISDAGANALFTISSEGEIATLAVFPDRMVDTSELPIPDLPPEIPMQAVPTGVTIGPDGAYYVGELTGFPFVPGSARVWRVTPDGEASVYAEGFTNIIDLAFDSAGNLYVLEITTNGLLSFFINPEDPAGLVGGLHRVAPDGARTRLAGDSLILSTGLAVGPDDSIYVAHFGLMPGGGQVVRIVEGA